MNENVYIIIYIYIDFLLKMVIFQLFPIKHVDFPASHVSFLEGTIFSVQEIPTKPSICYWQGFCISKTLRDQLTPRWAGTWGPRIEDAFPYSMVVSGSRKRWDR